MLVLRRKLSERIRLRVGDHDIWIEVTDRGSDWVRLGISAPPAVEITREELLPFRDQYAQSK